MATIIIDASGRVQIPQVERDQLGIKVNEAIELEVKGDQIILKPLTQEPRLVQKGSALVIETSPLGSVEDFNQLVDAFREERIQNQLSL